MRRITAVLTLLVAALAASSLSGCAQAGLFTAGNLTQVQLSQPNYKVVATGVSGDSEASYLIGVR